MTDYRTQIADESRNRIAGAIKQFDSGNKLTDEQAEEVADEMAEVFADYCTRFNLEVQKSLANGVTDDEPEGEDDG